MLKTVEGIFRGGRVELRENASAKDGDRVLVTFLPEEQPPEPAQLLEFGALRTEGREATWEDFMDAKQAMLKPIEETDGA